jgi:hypothetical protein
MLHRKKFWPERTSRQHAGVQLEDRKARIAKKYPRLRAMLAGRGTEATADENAPTDDDDEGADAMRAEQRNGEDTEEDELSPADQIGSGGDGAADRVEQLEVMNQYVWGALRDEMQACAVAPDSYPGSSQYTFCVAKAVGLVGDSKKVVVRESVSGRDRLALKLTIYRTNSRYLAANIFSAMQWGRGGGGGERSRTRPCAVHVESQERREPSSSAATAAPSHEPAQSTGK